MSWVPNVIGFQLVWLASVGGAARGWWWAGPVALLLFAALQLAMSAYRRADLLLLAICAALGLAVDSVWVWLDWMAFSSPFPWSQAAPIWIVAMWMGFALTLNHSLSSLKKLPWIAAALGVLGGPAAYWIAGSTWNAVAIVPSYAPYIGLALAWGVLTPLLLRCADLLVKATPSA